MSIRALTIATVAAGMFAAPQVAEASWAQVTGATALNLRACPSVQCARVAVMPAGAPVWIDGASGGWYHLVYNGVAGFASARYVTAAYGVAPLPPTVFQRPPPPPPFGPYWWDPRYGTWYNGSSWYFNGRWYNRPSGFFFGFRFGG